ncbi:Neuropeptide-Like Protein [Caenorhabditis elegans]|uniref:Neuropeptide-Like Protein n=1 Tax=Caenorhabditis elegans TaxID=6239 RepID=A0A679L8S7_CAEEL|nr:Uncharacterized protein CELE_Y39A3B.8 [Caenorhabditis elegans]CAA9991447.1 Uncharacterized protein CELE_Y39A3B.8 [Caenorhabditis elegans]
MKLQIFYSILLIFVEFLVDPSSSLFSSTNRKFDPNRPTMSNQGHRMGWPVQQRKANEEVVNSQRNTEFLIIH